MASIERTVYPRFTRAPSVKELREIYTPTPTDVAFVATHARGPAQKFAFETLLAEHCELPAFSTLDRLAWRIRTLVNGGIYQRILAKLSDEQKQVLSGLLITEGASAFTLFNRVKEAPKSATLTHLDEWLSRLIWLQSLLQTAPLIEGIRSTKMSQKSRIEFCTSLCIAVTLPPLKANGFE